MPLARSQTGIASSRSLAPAASTAIAASNNSKNSPLRHVHGSAFALPRALEGALWKLKKPNAEWSQRWIYVDNEKLILYKVDADAILYFLFILSE